MAWHNASRDHACAVCARTDWCRYDDDSGIVDCYRACGAGGVAKRDKLGQPFWRHSPSSSGAASSKGPTFREPKHEPEIVYQHERADADTLHAVYSDLLAALPLYDRHHRHLQDVRKLSDDETALLEYKSFPSERINADHAIDALLKKYAVDTLLRVPGFDMPQRHVDMIDRTNDQVLTLDATELRLSGAPGILLPVRDAKGHITGLMDRLDEPSSSNPAATFCRYLPVTSYTSTGCAASIGVHVPLHPGLSHPLGSRVIEGIIKADTSTLRTGVLCLGIPSGSRWAEGIRCAEALGVESILLSPDADTRHKLNICTSLTFAADALTAKGETFYLEVWPEEAGKGLDDVLNAGRRVEIGVLHGVERWRVLRDWLRSSGAARHPHIEARIALDGIIDRVTQDPLVAFTPGIAEALAALEPDTVEAQRLVVELRKRVQRWRDFDNKVKAARRQQAKATKLAALKAVAQSGKHVFNRGDQVEARDALLDDLTPVGGSGVNHALCVYDEGALYKYDDGIYGKLDEAALITRITTFAGSPIMNGEHLSVSRPFAKGSVELTYDKCAKVGFFSSAPHGVAFQNVFIYVDPEGRDVREEPLRREHRVRSRYPFDHMINVAPKLFLDLLDTGLDGKDDKTECIRVLQQFTGAAITGMAPRFQRALVFRGKGNDSKSTIATILGRVMPPGTTSAVPPQSFSHPYSRATLAGKLLNCVSETPENDLVDAGPLKALITGDPMEARNPYERPFTLVPRCGHLFVLNNIFKVRDTSRAFRRRWILIDFDVQVTTPDRFKVEAVLAEEIPAIVSWAIDGLRDLLVNDYVIPPSSEDAVDEWLDECDTVQQYVNAQLVLLAPQERTQKDIRWQKGDALYVDYKAWVRDNGHGVPLSSIRFLKRLRAHLGMAKGEGHHRDGNYYPVRFRELAAMIADAAANDTTVSLGDWAPPASDEAPLKPSVPQTAATAAQSPLAPAPYQVLDPTLPDGRYWARVVDLHRDTGELVLDVVIEPNPPWHTMSYQTPHVGKDLEAFARAVSDDGWVTIVRFQQRRENGHVAAKIVDLKPPTAAEYAACRES